MSVFYIQPKQDDFRHRQHQFTITFIPETRQWAWAFTVHTATTIRDIASTQEEAILAAKEHIDLLCGPQQ